jgi:hypothetical protein
VTRRDRALRVSPEVGKGCGDRNLQDFLRCGSLGRISRADRRPCTGDGIVRMYGAA